MQIEKVIKNKLLSFKEEKIIEIMWLIYNCFLKNNNKKINQAILDQFEFNFYEIFNELFSMYQKLFLKYKNKEINTHQFYYEYLLKIKSLFVDKVRYFLSCKNVVLTNSLSIELFNNNNYYYEDKLYNDNQYAYYQIFQCLSKNEKNIINLKLQGKTYKEIAKILNISYRTIRYIIEKIKANKNFNNILAKSKLTS